MRLLIVTAVAEEAAAIGHVPGARVIAGGIGRTNAACATTQAIMQMNRGGGIARENAGATGGFDAVISAGVAGTLPAQQPPAIGDVVVASACVYAEEGLMTPAGFVTMESIGFRLGDFEGNRVPVDQGLLDCIADACGGVGAIATVATCSGTDAAALEVVRRTGAVAEAMEGAAVVHAARRLGVPAIEIRAISNTTGDRSQQVWDIGKALAALHDAIHAAARALE